MNIEQVIPIIHEEVEFNIRRGVNEHPAIVPRFLINNLVLDGLICHYRAHYYDKNDTSDLHTFWVSPGKWSRAIIQYIGRDNCQGCVFDTLEKTPFGFSIGSYGVVYNMSYFLCQNMLNQIYNETENTLPFYQLLWFCKY